MSSPWLSWSLGIGSGCESPVSTWPSFKGQLATPLPGPLSPRSLASHPRPRCSPPHQNRMSLASLAVLFTWWVSSAKTGAVLASSPARKEARA